MNERITLWLNRGVLIIDVGKYPVPLGTSYEFTVQQYGNITLHQMSARHGKKFLGFHYYAEADSDSRNTVKFMLQTPIWFLTLLSAGVVWLVWRKTRPSVEGRAFPVEARDADRRET